MREREEALKIWQSLKTQDAANKTIEILCSIEEDSDHLRRLIKGYLKWVLEESPRQAVDFFIGKFPQNLNLSEAQTKDKVIFI